MRLNAVYEAADKLAPFALSGEYCEKYDAYDNSGVIVDCGNEIDKILFALDLSAAAIARAKRIGAQCIITHHPAVYAPVRALHAGESVFECVRAGISVVSAHLNLDCATDGIDESLMRGLGGTQAEAVMHSLSVGGYGRVSSVPQRTAAQFVSDVKTAFRTERVVCYGTSPVRRVASFCGAGMDEESVAFAVKNGADTFVSSDPKHHLIAKLTECGLNVVLLTHYAAEQYGFCRFYEKFKNTPGVACECFTDERYL